MDRVWPLSENPTFEKTVTFLDSYKKVSIAAVWEYTYTINARMTAEVTSASFIHRLFGGIPMGESMTRILVKTMVRKTIRDIKDSPERSIRNLVDMALNFSEGRFQQDFFRTAQRMLENENSAYYALVSDTVAHVDEDRLLTFGMNLGYNSCTVGAKRIREIEKESGYNIPWAVSLQLDSDGFSKNKDRYHSVIRQGQELGIFTWLLFAQGCVQEYLELAEANPDSVFIQLCRSADITGALIDCASDVNNLMRAVRYDEDAPLACSLLRDAELLYSVYCPYTQEDLQRIQNGDLLCDMEQLHPVFSAFLPEEGCPDPVQEQVYESVNAARMAQTYHTVAWELHRDGMTVDKIISEDPCWVSFDRNGNMYQYGNSMPIQEANLFQKDLPQIFQQVLSKA